MRGPIKLATIERTVCAALIDVSQEFDPTTVIWSARAADENTCQNPPVPSCPQARAEVQWMYPERSLPRQLAVRPHSHGEISRPGPGASPLLLR